MMSPPATPSYAVDSASHADCNRRKQKTYRHDYCEYDSDSLEQSFALHGTHLAEFQSKSRCEHICCLTGMDYHSNRLTH